MLTILSAALLLSEPAAAPAGSYSCENGRRYTIEADGAALSIRPQGLYIRTLRKTNETHIARFSDGGLTLISQGDVIMIGAPEAESLCKPAR